MEFLSKTHAAIELNKTIVKSEATVIITESKKDFQ